MTTSTAMLSNRWRSYAVCVGVAAIAILDLAKMNVAIPRIESELNAGPTALQLLVAGYALAFGLALVPAGRLGDVHSRRSLFMVGLALFTLSSLACALAPTATFLVAGRLAQGVAAGILMPQVFGFIQTLFEGAERARAFGTYGAVIGVSAALGPTIGGILIGLGGPDLGWRLLFWMNVPLGVIAFVLAARLLPKAQVRPSARQQLDIVGTLLLGAAILGVMLPFLMTAGDALRWMWLAAGLAAGVAFLAWERAYAASGRAPVVEFSLFRGSEFRNGLAISAFYLASVPAFILIATVYLQQGAGVEPVVAGLVTVTFPLGTAVTAWVGGRLVVRMGRRLVVLGLVGIISGFVLTAAVLVLAPREAVPWLTALALLVAGAGGGAVITPNQTLTVAHVPTAHAGIAGSLIQVGQRMGTAVGVSVSSAVFFGMLAASERTASAYRDALLAGGGVCVGIMVLSLVVASADLRARHRAET